MVAAHEPRRFVGQIFLDEGMLTPEELDRALAEQARTQRPLGEVVISLGLLSAGAVANALAEQHGGLLKTEYGISAGLHPGRLRSVATAAPAKPTPAPATDAAAAWRTAVADRDELIGQLREDLAARDAKLAESVAELEALRAQRRAMTAAAAPPADATGFVLFVPRGGGYELREGAGAPPSVGERLGAYVATQVGQSPLPGDARPCVYLTRAAVPAGS